MKTVLIVDDSRMFQKLLEKVLSPYYRIVGKGCSGTEGVELYKALRPDLVLMDITMPNCNGKEALQMIMDFDPQAKVMMISGLGDDATVAECLHIGARAFLSKNQISQNDGLGSPLLDTTRRVVGVLGTLEAA